MGQGFNKEPSSRPVKYQNLLIASPIVTTCSTPFMSGTQQIRVITNVAGWVSIDQSTSVTFVTSTAIPGAGLSIPASNAGAEYFTVTPGQILTFCTTGLTTGIVSVTEMG